MINDYTNTFSEILNFDMQLVATLAATAVAIVTYNCERKKSIPRMDLKELNFYKNSWIRFCDGVDPPPYIPFKMYNDLSYEERFFFDNCRKSENRMKIYFDILHNNTILVINFSDETPTTLVEHQCNTITFENNSEIDIMNFAINNITIKMFNGETCYLEGGNNNCYNRCIHKGEKIDIIIDEVVNSLSSSSCRINKENYGKLNDVNLLLDTKSTFLIFFSSVIAEITLEDVYGKKYKYDFVIKKNGQRLIAEMKYKNFPKRIFNNIK